MIMEMHCMFAMFSPLCVRLPKSLDPLGSNTVGKIEFDETNVPDFMGKSGNYLDPQSIEIE